MIDKSLLQIQKDIKNKQYSLKELIDEQIALIKQSDINAVTYVNENAYNLDNVDFDKPLFGLTVLHKDNIAVKDMPLTCSSKMLQDFVAPYNATLVDKLAKAGAVCLGKTNMDEFAMGSSTSHSFFGTTLNPWNHEKTCGGSSGGSAASVAAGLASIATGTDTGGSIRQPAAFCGVAGFKPSYGSVSRFGVTAYASSLDQAGPIGRYVEDIAKVYEVIHGKDPFDATSVNNKHAKINLEQSLKGKVIGIEPRWIENLQSSILQTIFTDALAIFKDLGATIKEVQIDNIDLALPCYYVISAAEAASNLARFDGIRYGHQNLESDIDIITANRTSGFGEEVKRRILLGNFVLASNYNHDYHNRALNVRQMLQNNYLSALKDVDILFTPVTNGTAFTLGSQSVIEEYENDKYTVGVNLAGLPSLSIPIGFDQGLPFAGQLIARHNEDPIALNFGHMFQTKTIHHKVKPIK